MGWQYFLSMFAGGATVIALWLSSGLPATSPPAEAAGEREARELFQRAEISFNLGKFPEALADYESAYRAKPLPGFLFNIAQCHRNMAQYEQARFVYRRYLTAEPRSPHRSTVEGLIAEMTRRIEREQRLRTASFVVPGASPASADREPPLVSTPGAAVSTQVTSEPRSVPIYKRWWFWTGVGVVVTGAAVAAYSLATAGDPSGSLGSIDARSMPEDD
jgi:tetratricopeptide (TPR) repeat protein